MVLWGIYLEMRVGWWIHDRYGRVVRLGEFDRIRLDCLCSRQCLEEDCSMSF